MTAIAEPEEKITFWRKQPITEDEDDDNDFGDELLDIAKESNKKKYGKTSRE
jgi:hypothetical protein